LEDVNADWCGKGLEHERGEGGRKRVSEDIETSQEAASGTGDSGWQSASNGVAAAWRPSVG